MKAANPGQSWAWWPLDANGILAVDEPREPNRVAGLCVARHRTLMAPLDSQLTYAYALFAGEDAD